MKEKFRKIKKYLIISTIILFLILFFAVGLKNEGLRNILSYILAFVLIINFIIFIIYKIKRKKYKFYRIKENGIETEVEIKEE